MEQDQVCYHHFSLTFDQSDIKRKFQNVRFVLIAGASSRIEACAKYFESEQKRLKLIGGENIFNIDKNNDDNDNSLMKYECLTHPGSRYDLYKFGCVLLSSHGIGSSSMSTAVNELLLMCREADCLDKVTVIRIGTCGGIGVDPGTLCITTKAVDPLFREHVEIPICGKLIIRKSTVDQITANKLLEAGQQLAQQQQQINGKQEKQFVALSGCTISANDFYEEQGRTNGIICDHSLDDKYQFLMTARDKNVINMEMEACYLMAMCHKINVKVGVVCVALTNRLVTDRILLSRDEICEFEKRLFRLCLIFIRNQSSSSLV